MMSRKYEREFKRKIVRLHLEEGRTYKSICEEYGVFKSAVTRWCEEYWSVGMAQDMRQFHTLKLAA